MLMAAIVATVKEIVSHTSIVACKRKGKALVNIITTGVCLAFAAGGGRQTNRSAILDL